MFIFHCLEKKKKSKSLKALSSTCLILSCFHFTKAIFCKVNYFHRKTPNFILFGREFLLAFPQILKFQNENYTGEQCLFE